MSKTTSKLLVAALATSAIVAPVSASAASEVQPGVYFEATGEFYTVDQLSELGIAKVGELFSQNNDDQVYIYLESVGVATLAQANETSFISAANENGHKDAPENIIPDGSYTTADGTEVVIGEDEEAPVELAVESVSATDATTLSVTLSDETTHVVTLAEALEANVVTEVTFEIDGKEYTATVTWEVEETDLAVESVSAINPTTIQVIFNEDVTEEALATSNYTLSKGTIEAVTATGNVATINVAGLTYGDAVTVTVGNPAYTKEVTVPQVSDLFNLEITTDAPSDTIKSDGATKTQVTVTLIDKATGELVDRDGIVQFQSTDGGLGQTTSALVDGKATVQLTSVASATSITSILTATVSDVPGAQEFKGLTAQKAIIFSPDAVTEGQVKFVQAVSAESTQGDRLFVTFSDKISAAEYKKVVTTNTGVGSWPVAQGYGLVIDGRYVKVKDVVNKTDNTLEFILDVDQTTNLRIENTSAWDLTTVPAPAFDALPGLNTGNYLRDNVEHTVAFPANVGSLVLSNTTGVKFIKTDTSRPGVYGVTAKDQLNIEVRYTESVNRQEAIKEEKYSINGKKLKLYTTIPTAKDIADEKAANRIIVTSITNGDYTAATATAAAKDERNLVKFTIHSDFALASGAHTIQISNIWDYAGDVDPAQNRLETDTFDFNLVADTSKPVATITTESPEQWLVSYDKPVSTVTGKKAKDVIKVKTGNAEDAELVYDTDFVVYQVDASGVAGKKVLAGDTITNGQYFLIEFLQDWTVKYDTKGNPTKTYFGSTQNPYKVTLENVRTLVGNVQDKQELNVTLSLDGTSPTIVSAVDVFSTDSKKYATNVPTATGAPTQSDEVKGAGQFVHVQFSEPMQFNSGTTAAPVNPAEGLTPSQDQYTNTGVAATHALQTAATTAQKAQAVSPSTYEFVKGDKVVKAEIVTGTIAANDKSAVLKPEETLEAGTWTLYVRSITDDIGNALTTSTTQVVIQPSAQAVTGTQIAWAAFDDASTGIGTDAAGKRSIPTEGLTDYDAIYVKFTTEMNPNGANGVSRTQNYVFKGQALPIGSKVVQGIAGVTNNWDGVTILVPTDTWNGVPVGVDFTTALNIASNFTSATGELLTGRYEVELTDISGAVANNQLEAAYTQTDGLIVGGTATAPVKAIVLGATAKDVGTFAGTPAALNTTANGKIDTIELTVDKAVTGLVTTATATATSPAYEINVNGQAFVLTANNSSATPNRTLTFTAKSAANELSTTAASNLKVTNTNGAILVNTGSVVDDAAPVITKAQLSSDKTKVTVTFSEAVYQDATLAQLNADDKAKFVVGGTAAAVTSVEQTSPTTVVLTVSNGNLLTTASTITAGTGTVVDATTLAWAAAFSPIAGAINAADLAAATPVSASIASLPALGTVNSTHQTAIQAARTAYNALTAAQKALVVDEAKLKAVEAELAVVTALTTNVPGATTTINTATNTIDVTGVPVGTKAVDVLDVSALADAVPNTIEIPGVPAVTISNPASPTADDIAKVKSAIETALGKAIEDVLASELAGVKLTYGTETYTIDSVTP